MINFRIPYPIFRICFLLMICVSPLKSQIYTCETPSITPQEYEILLQGMTNTPMVAGSSVWNIPIWITLVRNDNGTSSNNDNFFPQLLIEQTNSYFNNGMRFYLCGVTYVNNSAWHILGLSGSQGNPSEWDQLVNYVNAQNSQQYAKGYINVSIVGGLENSGASGKTIFPTSSIDHGKVVITANNANVLAHELGHFFLVPHTFALGPVGPDPVNHPEYGQFVDHDVTLNGNFFTCWQTGDGFCDTPADPGNDYCSGGCSINSCNITDPLGQSYHPDKTLLMSYYDDCRNRFTDEQNQRMVTVYTAFDNWLFLYDPFFPICQSLASDAGFVKRDCSMGGSASITPAKGVAVSLKDATGQTCGNILPITDALGRYHTYPCVFPSYSGTGLLSPLPDKEYLAPNIGISTLDLVLISKHVLGIEPFANPFQLIAADENNSGSVTTFDILEIRKLLLGIKTNFTAGTWRYVPDYCFANPAFEQEFNDDDDPNTPGLQLNPFNAVWTNPDEINGQVRTYGPGALPALPNTTSWMDHVSINPTSLAAQQARPWSFWAIKTGDVNCSADIDGAVSPHPPDESFSTLPHSPISANQVFTLQIRALGNVPVTAWQLGIDFAKDSLQILEVLAGNSGENFSVDNFGLTHVGEGQFRALNYSATGSSTNLYDKTLFKIHIKALKPITNISQRFRLKNTVLQEIFYASDGFEIENMPLRLEVSTGLSTPNPGNNTHPNGNPGDAYQLTARPSPFGTEINLDFLLPNSSRVHFALYDSRGQLVAQRTEDLPEGEHTLRLDHLDNLPAGLYWYRFEADGKSVSGKTVKQ